MLSIAPEVIKNAIDNKVLPENYNNLNIDQITNLYKNILEISFEMSKNFSYQYDDINYIANQIEKESICQICYDMKIIKIDNKILIELDGLVVNNNILKNIKLENTKNYNLQDVINKIKDEHELFKVNLKDIENTCKLKLIKHD
jgi:glutamyl/glutaminyl-tRNA synthetase